MIDRPARCLSAAVTMAAAIVLTAAAGSAQVVSYPAVPGAALSSTYSMTVNGQAVAVEKYGAISFGRFAFAGSANVVVTVNQAVSSYTLSPTRSGIKATASGSTISFTLPSPRRMVLRKVNALPEELFILADALESNPPQPGGAGVTVATSVGVNNAGTANASPTIQTAINNITAAGGGTLYLPAGLYRIEQALLLKSNVNLYLAPGSVLQVPLDVPCCLQNQSVITLADATNAKLSGRGVIYGQGSINTAITSGFHMVYTENLDSSTIEDVTILDPGITGMRLVDARNTTVRNIKILAINPQGLSDGIDIDSSQNITIDNAFIYSSDDNTSLGGGTGVRKTVKDITGLNVQNSVFYNLRTGASFKIGTTDPQANISGLTYQNIDIVRATQMAAFYPTQGANIDTITLKNVYAEDIMDRVLEFMIVIPNWEPWNGRLGYIHNIYLTGVGVDNSGVRNSAFTGYDATRNINNVVFTNYQLGGYNILNQGSAKIDMSSYVSNLVFSAPVTGPSISAVAVGGVTASSTTMTWTTNIAADSQVEYGPTTAYGTSSTINSAAVLAHSVTVGGLSGATAYHCRVKSRDASGNVAVSGDYTFTTAGTPAGPLPAGTWYLSSLTPTLATNGWGPAEKDMSNGEMAAGDGHTLTLNGTTYARGLGVHANSDVRFTLGGSCNTFTAAVGVDDEQAASGTVDFQVWTDGIQVFDSGVMNGNAATKGVSVSVAGKSELRLVVTDGGDGNSNDHADWADAKVVCGAGTVTAPVITTATPALGTTNVSSRTKVQAVFSMGMLGTSINLGTFTLVKQGTTAPVPAMVSYSGSNYIATLTPNAALQLGAVYTATVKSGVLGVQSSTSVPLAADKTWTFTVSASAPPPVGTIAVSSLTPTYSANGWGPYEKNLSNGEQLAGDGHTLTLRGKTYATGLGVHAPSELRYSLGGACSTFTALVGVDDEVGAYGSVNFQVWLDGSLAYDSGTLKGGGATASPNINVYGKGELKLIVTNGGDDVNHDHADWASAQVVCQ